MVKFEDLSAVDQFVLDNCVNQNGVNLLCCFPEHCSHCIYYDVLGSHDMDKALSLYEKWQAYISEF